MKVTSGFKCWEDQNIIHPKLESLQSILTLKLLKLQTNMRKIFEPPTTKDILVHLSVELNSKLMCVQFFGQMSFSCVRHNR